MAENEKSSDTVREEILDYYKELKFGSSRALAVMDCVREVELSAGVEGAQIFSQQESGTHRGGHNQTELDQQIAHLAIRQETMFNRIQTIEGYASEYEKAKAFISEYRSSIADQREHMDINVSNDVSEFFTEQVIQPLLGIKMK